MRPASFARLARSSPELLSESVLGDSVYAGLIDGVNEDIFGRSFLEDRERIEDVVPQALVAAGSRIDDAPAPDRGHWRVRPDDEEVVSLGDDRSLQPHLDERFLARLELVRFEKNDAREDLGSP